MSEVSSVRCPGCRGRIARDPDDLRQKKSKLRCPYCNREFVQEESPPAED